jgi:hypothetical protein
VARLDLEERLVGARQRAARERDAERTRAVVGAAGEPGDLGEVRAALCGGAGDAEDGQVARDAAALVDLALVGGRDVIRDGDGLALDAAGAELLLRRVEVEHVAGVVAVAEEDAAAVLDGLRDREDLLRGG